jgi:hypothetical protein
VKYGGGGEEGELNKDDGLRIVTTLISIYHVLMRGL